MPTLTLGTARAHLQAWVAADLALSYGQTFSMEGRTLTRSDTAEVRGQINYWSRLEAQLEQRAASSGNRSRFGVARF